MPGFIALRELGFCEPRDGLVELALLHQVDSDVVVRIPKIRIELDGLLAVFDRFIQAAFMRERPSSKSVAFRRGLDRDALLEQLDGLLDLALAQTSGSQLPQFARSFVVCHTYR